MCDCKCDDKEHHKEMTHEERLDHIRECLDSAVHRLECVREELDKIAPKE